MPELRQVPSSRIHEPWLMGRDELAAAGVQLGAPGGYPMPLKSSWKGEAAWTWAGGLLGGRAGAACV